MRKPVPHVAADRWMRAFPQADAAISVMTLHEFRIGAELLPPGRRREALERWIDLYVRVEFADRMLPVTERIADLAAVRTISAKSRGHNIELADALIAATAEVHGLQVVTLNRRHFQHLGVSLVNL